MARRVIGTKRPVYTWIDDKLYLKIDDFRKEFNMKNNTNISGVAASRLFAMQINKIRVPIIGDITQKTKRGKRNAI